MTINSLNLNESTPVTNLDTFTFNVPTTGLYTVGLNFTVPWQTNDSPSYKANLPAFEIQNITFAADTSGNKNSTFFTFHNASNLNGYYVWFNINSAGVDPAPAGLTGIRVNGATGVTAANLATAAISAINTAAPVNVVASAGVSGHIILTNTTIGTTTAAANGTASPSFSYSVTTTGSYGTSSGLIVTVNLNSTSELVIGPPTPTQPALGSSVRIQASAADTITVVTTSSAPVDQYPNAIKGIINIFAGE